MIVVDLWYIGVHQVEKFYTDDSYEFNKGIKDILEILVSFNPYQEPTEEADEIDFMSFFRDAESEEVKKNEIGVVMNEWVYGGAVHPED